MAAPELLDQWLQQARPYLQALCDANPLQLAVKALWTVIGIGLVLLMFRSFLGDQPISYKVAGPKTPEEEKILTEPGINVREVMQHAPGSPSVPKLTAMIIRKGGWILCHPVLCPRHRQTPRARQAGDPGCY